MKELVLENNREEKLEYKATLRENHYVISIVRCDKVRYDNKGIIYLYFQNSFVALYDSKLIDKITDIRYN